MKACDNQPLLTAGDELKTIMKGVCELMSVQRVASKVHNGTDLESILEQNIIDSCHWVSYRLSAPSSKNFVFYLKIPCLI